MPAATDSPDSVPPYAKSVWWTQCAPSAQRWCWVHVQPVYDSHVTWVPYASHSYSPDGDSEPEQDPPPPSRRRRCYSEGGKSSSVDVQVQPHASQVSLL